MSLTEHGAEREPAGPLDAAGLLTLRRTWSRPPGVLGWLATVDHKSIALRKLSTAMVWFLLAGLLALVMRTQLARPENGLVGPDLYNQLFSTHGTAMMFLFAVPVMDAAGLYLVPLMVGTRNVAFPRLNQFGYWVFLVGGCLLFGGLLLNTGADSGWSAHTPLSGPEFSPGKRMDVWAQTVTFTEIAALVAAVQIIVTVFKQRAPGMSLNRMPVFVWSMLVVSFMVVVAMTTVAVASLMLAGDRLVGTHFFNPAEGGDPLLWQHLFWYFGHPEVYIVFIPALGMISSIVAAAARRPIFGYTAVAVSLVGTGFLSFGLWVHHMFAGPIPQLGASLFTATSSLVAVFTGTQIFCWIATLWLGRPRLTVPLLFVLGFFGLFVIGGVTGVMLGSVPFDLQAHDTYFVVAHFHYVLIGGAVSPLFGAFYFWFPKVTGRMLSERLGRLHFWLFVGGVNLAFFPMHFVGLWGMPRRVYTYPVESGWGMLNLVETAGAYLVALSVAVFLWNVARALRHGAPAGENPWNAETLEWGTASPPPPHNFDHLPVVNGRSPLWERPADAPVVTGLSAEEREVLVTTVMDAYPESRHTAPRDTLWPLAAALAVGVTFVALIFTPLGLPVGAALLFPTLVAWGWPEKPRPAEAAA